MSRLTGRSLAHYRVGRLIGAGGMGEVYEAEDLQLERRVALKVLPAAVSADRERLARFTREARALAALNHPGIVTVYSVDEADGEHFITMELVEGGRCRPRSLRRGCRRRGSWSSRRPWPTLSPRPTSRASSTGTSSPRTS